jgi:hypothetical protein
MTYVVRGGVRRNARVQHVANIGHIWGIGGIGVCCVQNSVRPGGRAFRARNLMRNNKSFRAGEDNTPILINFTQLVFVATLELPKVTLVETNKNSTLSPFDRELVKLF